MAAPAGRRRSITSSGGLHIEGLSDFVAALKRVDREYSASIRDANYRLARKLVDLAKDRARRERGVARKAAKSLRASRSASSSVVSGGGPRYPYFYGAEFGAKQYRQFQEWRGNQWQGWDGGPGYFLHPTIREHAHDLIQEYIKELDELYGRAFPN